MTVFVALSQIVDTSHDHCIDDDYLTEEDNFAAWNTSTQERPSLLTVCIL